MMQVLGSCPYRSITIEGKDCVDLFHRITTQNIKTLSDIPKPFFILNALAGIQTGGYIVKKTPTSLCVLTNDSSFEQQADKLIFQEDINFKSQELFLGVGDEELKNSSFQSDLEIWRIPLVHPFAQLQPHPFLVDVSINEKTYKFLEIQSCTFRIHEEIQGDLNPLEVLQDDAIDFKKGCYPGQEILERMDSRKIPPSKRMVKIVPSNSENYNKISAGDLILRKDDKKETGKCVSVLEDKGEFLVVALLRKDQAVEGTTVILGNENWMVQCFSKDPYRLPNELGVKK